jgi:ElaB/YqjD/DUF883 family membrane-anchored ribosome-binding protein
MRPVDYLAEGAHARRRNVMAAEPQVQVTTEKLMEDLRIVVRDAEALLKATAGQAGEKIQEVRARAEESLRHAKVRMSEMEDAAITRAKELVGTTEDYVRENPWQALGIAAAVGMFLGLMLRRR